MAQTDDPKLQLSPVDASASSTGDASGDADAGEQARERSLQLGGGVPSGAFLGRYAAFLGEVREEMRKVTWPTRKQVVTETIVVICVVIFFALLITGVDSVFATFFNWFLFGKPLPWQNA
ncbi:MAG: preprotein translocase subunit SecE [Candidatus Sericytochromatia bacterium]|nr:preprotein translocase subunit SecE [Candidatus Sericytochromatia bacterium]